MDATTARRPSRVNSRPMMIIAIHGDARWTLTRATRTPETSSLSAVVSRNEPSFVVTFQRRASRPSNQSVDDATRKTIAAAVNDSLITSAITIGTATILTLVPAMRRAVARSGPVRSALSAPASIAAILPMPRSRISCLLHPIEGPLDGLLPQPEGLLARRGVERRLPAPVLGPVLAQLSEL